MSLEKPTNDHLVDVENTTSTTPPKSSTASDAELYPVEKLCRERYDWHGKRWFRVKWEGTEERSWEPEENVATCLVKEFERKRKLRRKMKKGNSGKVKAEDGNSSDDVVLVGSKILPQFTCDIEGCVKVFTSLSSLRQHKTKVHFPKDSDKKTVEKDSGKKEVVKEGKRKRDACKTVSSPSGDVKYYWICAQCNFEATSFRQLQQHKKGHTTTATSIKEGTIGLETIPATMDKPVEVESSACVDVIGSEVEVMGTGFGARDSTQIIIDSGDENEEIEAAASESSTEGSSSETQVSEGEQEAEEVPITAASVNNVTVDSDLSRSSLVISSDSETEQGQMDTSDKSSSEVSNEPTPTGKKRKVAEIEDQDQHLDIKSIKVEPEDVKPTPDSDALFNAWKLAEKQYLDKLKKERDELKQLYEAEKAARLAEAAKVQDLECKLKEEQSKIEALKITLGEALGKL